MLKCRSRQNSYVNMLYNMYSSEKHSRFFLSDISRCFHSRFTRNCSLILTELRVRLFSIYQSVVKRMSFYLPNTMPQTSEYYAVDHRQEEAIRMFLSQNSCSNVKRAEMKKNRSTNGTHNCISGAVITSVGLVKHGEPQICPCS